MFFFLTFWVEISLPYNVVLVLSEQEIDSVIHILVLMCMYESASQISSFVTYFDLRISDII